MAALILEQKEGILLKLIDGKNLLGSTTLVFGLKPLNKFGPSNQTTTNIW
jgi:hypothetical protein